MTEAIQFEGRVFNWLREPPHITFAFSRELTEEERKLLQDWYLNEARVRVIVISEPAGDEEEAPH